MITIGADPEVFVQDNGTIVPVTGKIGGTKYEPKPVQFGAIQEDNVLAEFNIDPVDNVGAFKRNIKAVMTQLKAELKCDLRVKASHHFDKSVLMHDRQAMRFGCDPDFNAYTGGRNKPPKPFTTLRTAGGHIHVGYNNPNPEKNRRIVQAMDVILGVPSVLLDSDTDRRSLYGNAGAYRDKPYGVEYRTLSNFWLASEDLQEWAFRKSVEAVDYDVDQAHALFDPEYIQSVINNSDRHAAMRIMTELNLETA